MLSKQVTLTRFFVLISPPACNKTWAPVHWNQTCCHDFARNEAFVQEDNQFTFHFYYLRNTSVHIVDGSAWPSQRDGTAYNSEPSKSQWQIWVLCGHWADTLNIDTVLDLMERVWSELELRNPLWFAVWMASGSFLHGNSLSLPVIHTHFWHSLIACWQLHQYML